MYWIVEPHSDDAYLSLHTHITTLWKDYPKTILTVFSTPKRTAESATYAKAVGCNHISPELEEGGGLSKGAGYVPPFEEWGVDLKPGDVLVFPVGLQHPDHLAVVDRIPDRANGVKPYVYRYLDTPYYSKQKLADEMNEKVGGMRVYSMLYSSKTKWKHIPTFKSQAKFFHYNPPESLPRLEIVLR